MRRALAWAILPWASAAQAHVPAAAAADLSSAGSDWLVASLLALAVILQISGLVRLWPHARGRRELLGRAVCFWAGCVALGMLLLGPLDAAAPRSFALHMIQHEGLMLIAAPLLVLGRALPLFFWAMPHDARMRAAPLFQSRGLRSGWQWFSAPLMAWLLHAAALWVWHAPVLFNAALRDPVVHEWQHVTFLSSALLFWHAVLRRGTHGQQALGMLYLLTTTIHTSVLGALLTFAPRPLFELPGLLPYSGLGPLEDQQLGGLIMWVPGALVYVGMALWLLARWVGPERAPAGQQA